MRLALSIRAIALSLFFSLFALYQANWTEMIEGDTYLSMNLPYSLLDTGKLSIDPEREPIYFRWETKAPLDPSDDVRIRNWNEVRKGKTLAEWRLIGAVRLYGPQYFVVESRQPGEYVNTFGPIPAFVLLPIAYVVKVVDPAVYDKMSLKLAVGKLGGSAMVAGTTVLVFLIALRLTSRWRALFVALAFGIGSCAWSVSSQSLWQQTVNQLLLTAGLYAFLKATTEVGWRAAAVSGFWFGAAVASRVTAGAVFAAALVYLALYHRRHVLPYLVGSLPVPILIGAYNWHFLGSPLTFAQELVGHTLALEKTGSPDLWQTPLLRGLRGLLFSPSRGLVVFSPLLVLAFFGMWKSFRSSDLKPLRPFVVSTLLMMAVQCKWFDWWGGWTYGYRPWLEVLPFLAVFLIPALDVVLSRRSGQAICALGFAWSVFVQAIGAWSYDRSWNERRLFVVEVPGGKRPEAFTEEPVARAFAERHGYTYLGGSICNIDLSWCRHRLWSWSDNIIHYHLTHLSETHARRTPIGWKELTLRTD